jgi:hypothetical protein
VTAHDVESKSIEIKLLKIILKKIRNSEGKIFFLQICIKKRKQKVKQWPNKLVYLRFAPAFCETFLKYHTGTGVPVPA